MAFRHLVVVFTIAAGIVVSVTGLHAQQGRALTDVREENRAARFAITIDGVEIASFTRV